MDSADLEEASHRRDPGAACDLCGEPLGFEAMAEVIFNYERERAEGNAETGPRAAEHSIIHSGCYYPDLMELC